MHRMFASLALLSLFGLVTTANAESFSLPSGSTVLVDNVSYTITGSVVANSSYQITSGSFTVDGLPSLGNTTFSFSSGGIQGGPLNQYDHNVYDQTFFNSVTDANGIAINSGSLALYSLVEPANGDLTICNGYCGTAVDYATEPSGISISFAASPWYLSGNFGGSLDPVVTTAINPLVSSTPEPSPLVLLGTGVLGVAGAVRRRLAKR